MLLGSGLGAWGRGWWQSRGLWGHPIQLSLALSQAAEPPEITVFSVIYLENILRACFARDTALALKIQDEKERYATELICSCEAAVKE